MFNRAGIIFFSLLVSSVAFAKKPKFSDQQVAAMAPKYFARDHLSPPLKRVRIYPEENKKVFELEIEVNRNRYEGEMEYAVGAMSSICQYARIPFDKFVVVMVPTHRGQDVERLEATAACSINYFVHKRVKYQRWVEKCTSITTL